MKLRKEIPRKGQRNSAVLKKSPTLKYTLFKRMTESVAEKQQFQPNPPICDDQASSRGKDAVPTANKFRKIRLTAKSSNKFLTLDSPVKFVQIQGKNGDDVRSPNALRLRKNSLNGLKKGKDSRSFREPSTNSHDETESDSKPMVVRFEKFAFRSQKYMKLHSELQLQANERQYEQSVKRLNSDIEYFKNMHSNSMIALQKMEKVFKKERQNFQEQKLQYQEQIKSLRQRIVDQKINLGHLFSYKEWESQNLLPETMILERCEESSNCSLIVPNKINTPIRQRAEDIMRYYLSLSNLQQQDQCLSLNSRQ